MNRWVDDGWVKIDDKQMDGRWIMIDRWMTDRWMVDGWMIDDRYMDGW